MKCMRLFVEPCKILSLVICPCFGIASVGRVGADVYRIWDLARPPAYFWIDDLTTFFIPDGFRVTHYCARHCVSYSSKLAKFTKM